jgi:hypothetical protein
MEGVGDGSGVFVAAATSVGLDSVGSSESDSEDISGVDSASNPTGDEISLPGVPQAKRMSAMIYKLI